MQGVQNKRLWLVTIAIAAIATLVTGLSLILPTNAYATELVAGQTQTQAVSQTQAVQKTTTRAAKAANPYKDVIKGKTVDKIGYRAIKYVKAHKGYNGVIKKNARFYPTKSFTKAQFSRILRNLYGNKVALSKSKAAVTGKYCCARLSSVAKNVFGVRIKWRAGDNKTKLSRTGVSNYIKTFAQWDNGLFAPKQ